TTRKVHTMMNFQNVTMDRRNVLRGAIAAAVLIPLGSTLASCATGGPTAPAAPGGSVSAKNPFGLAADSTVDSVIFDGGYGVDYVEFAAKILEKNHDGVS